MLREQFQNRSYILELRASQCDSQTEGPSLCIFHHSGFSAFKQGAMVGMLSMWCRDLTTLSRSSKPNLPDWRSLQLFGISLADPASTELAADGVEQGSLWSLDPWRREPRDNHFFRSATDGVSCQ